MSWTQDSMNTNKTLSSIARCEGVTTYEYIIKSISVTRHIKTITITITNIIQTRHIKTFLIEAAQFISSRRLHCRIPLPDSHCTWEPHHVHKIKKSKDLKLKNIELLKTRLTLQIHNEDLISLNECHQKGLHSRIRSCIPGLELV